MCFQMYKQIFNILPLECVSINDIRVDYSVVTHSVFLVCRSKQLLKLANDMAKCIAFVNTWIRHSMHDADTDHSLSLLP